MSAPEFLGGLALLVLTLGSACFFAVAVLRRRLAGLSGSPRLVAGALLATAAFFVIHLVPAALTILGRPAVAMAAIAVLALAALIPAGERREAEPAFPLAPESRVFSWAIAGTALGLLLVYVVAHLIEHGREAVSTPDMMTFHLPNVARWIESGSIWQDTEFVPLRSFGTYPNTGDVISLGWILPFDNEFLVRFAGIPFLALIALAIYSLARELGAPTASAALFAAGFTTMPVVMFPALEALPDTVMVATFSSGVLFLVRHRRTGSTSDLVLAGVGLGLAAGAKWYGPVAVAVTIAVWLGAGLLERTQFGLALRRFGILAGLVAAIGGFWLLRNLVELDNPVFPVEVTFGGVTIFDAPYDVRREEGGFSLSHYFGDPDVWREIIWPNLLRFMSWFAVVLWAALPLAGALAWSRRKSAEAVDAAANSVLVCAAIAAGIGVVYLFLPYSAEGPEGNPALALANSRYVVPGLVLAAAVAAWAAGRLGRLRPVFELGAFLGFMHALTKDPDFSGDLSAGAVALAVVVLAAVAGALWMGWRSASTIRRRPVLAAGTAAAVALLATGALYVQEERYNDDRYADGEPAAAWVTANAPSGVRVGIAGEGFHVYPMFGPRLENEVEYVGPVVDGLLRPYERLDEFEAAIERGDYDLVLLQRGDHLLPGLPARQARSLVALGYREVASGHVPNAPRQRKTLFRAP